MAKKKSSHIDFPFYTYLKLYHDTNKRKIYSSYKPLTRKFLDFNNPENSTAYLRKPQFEALEMYVFVKEYCKNDFLYQIFDDWFNKKEAFEGRETQGLSEATGQIGLFGPKEFDDESQESFKQVFQQIETFKQEYPNYIFSLTMGLGKTVLMATSIFYEFLLANKYPKTSRYCHNALVFAPDKTVLQSLREIETFDKSKIIPPEYVNWLDTHLKFHFLDDTGVSLNALDNSKYNIIISNTQKIILKKKHKDKSPSESLFNSDQVMYQAKSLNKDFEDLYGFDINTDTELLSNQRFSKLTRLRQLGIYVDEAHHVFGTKLAQDFGLKKSSTSLRVTINELAASLSQAGSRVVGCYNYTGTPYVGKRLLPEVIYSYGLRPAIDNKYLKKVAIDGFENIKGNTKTFIKTAVKEFWDNHNGKRYENMLPKMAFFASNINELQTELKPILEEVLIELNIPTSKILVNVGDSKITSNDDLREFKNLDTPASDKQFILLVNKGKEGWNCRSLFAVGLHRKPKSKIFVLQATMRCLRAISETQQQGNVYLSDENIKILEDELDQNFNMTIDDLTSAGDDKELVDVKLVPPPVMIKLKRIKRLHKLKDKKLDSSIDLELEKIDYDRYTISRSRRNIKEVSKKLDKEEITAVEERQFSNFTLVAEIARYLYHPEGVDSLNKVGCIEIKKALSNSIQGIDKVREVVNKHNVILYDYIIPKLFNSFYDIESFEKVEEEEVELVKVPDQGYYSIKAKKKLIASLYDDKYKSYSAKSFHLDNYCFDSVPESDMFWNLINKVDIEKVWFTGMLTHGQSEFVIRYIDPVSHTVRSYYPDFLVKMKTDDNSDKYVIIEVKGDNKVDDEVVQAKASYADQLAGASGMTYQIVKGSEVSNSIIL